MAIKSPCVGFCQLCEIKAYCRGCYRTRDEIGSWSLASDEEKTAIISRVRGIYHSLEKREFRDALGRESWIHYPIDRIVSLVP